MAGTTPAVAASAAEGPAVAGEGAEGQVEEPGGAAAVTAEIEDGYPKIVTFAGKRQVLTLP